MKPLLISFLSCVLFCVSSFSQQGSVNPGINDPYLKTDMQVAEWVERFEKEGREVFDNRQKLVDAIGLKPGMAVADIGTGIGVFLPALSEAVGPDGKIYAVDIVSKFLTHIDELADENQWTTVETVLCTERSVELPENSIDVAFICDVYHHFEYPDDSLASLNKALKKGGQIFLIDFKRIEGESSEWMLKHMRAGQEVFEAEIIRNGFSKVEELSGILEDNYVVRFEKN